MDVTLPNGRIIKGIPDGTSKDAIMQKAIISGLAKQEDFQQSQPTGVEQDQLGQFKDMLLRQARGEQIDPNQLQQLQSNLSQQQESRPQIEPPQPTQEQIDALESSSITDVLTGADRMTPEMEDLENIGSAPEFNEMSLGALKSNIASFTTSDQSELKGILKKEFSDRVSFSKDSKGNDIVNFESGSYALNKPGISPQDVPRFFGDLLAFSPAGKSKSIAGAMAKSALGEGALESVDKALGGDFSVGDIAESALIGGAFKKIEDVVSRVYGGLKSLKDDIPATRAAADKIKDSVKEQAKVKRAATDEDLDKIAEAIKKGGESDLANLVDADPKFYQAADELGINTEPLASFASRNPQFVSLESGLASVPSSQLDVQTKEFIKETAKKADDLIADYGGTLDKGQLNIEFKRKAVGVIDDLEDQADILYGEIAKSLPKSGRYDATETVGFIEDLAKDLGGVKELPTRLKAMLASLKTKAAKPEKSTSLYHGTPYKFKSPNMSRYGEGEGGQGFGYGFHTAASKVSAKNYATELKLVEIDGRKFYGNTNEADIAMKILDEGYDKTLKNAIAAVDEYPDLPFPKQKLELVKKIGTSKITDLRSSGNIHKFDIPDKELKSYIDYDKKIRHQSEGVIKKLKESGDIKSLDESGRDLYYRISDLVGGDKEASNYLNDLGVKGIRYTDELEKQRQSGVGSHYNYTIFSPEGINKNAKTLRPTLGKIDQLRREVGQAANKKTGPFKDVESGLNKALYSRLRSDQDAIARKLGMSELTDTAKNLITKRKQLEDNLKTLLGKDLNKALSINVATSLKGLAKGDVARFNQVMNAIPKNQRVEAVLTALNDVFKGSGVNQQSLSPTQYVKWFESINRYPAVKKRLMQEIPIGARKGMENIYTISKGISSALGERVSTGRLNAMFNEDTGFLRRIVGRAAPSVVAMVTGSPTASLMTSSTMEFLKQNTSGSVRASNLLASSEFKNIVRASAKDGSLEAAKETAETTARIANISKKSVFKKWKDSLGKKQKAELERLGLLKYLFATTETESGE